MLVNDIHQLCVNYAGQAKKCVQKNHLIGTLFLYKVLLTNFLFLFRNIKQHFGNLKYLFVIIQNTFDYVKCKLLD